ncbi:LPS-assembly lipoprotein [Bartonella callosciuri]|uniref:LPS-assembly lipoprotein n=1 Tax=Bartonella callosciuri TaxID=686223 RepID=A0A840NRR9_9HYPH|nr:LPS assembly lipoprotein LptE [Bartonella callosciuri]MBB5074224.1 LPS-assembly lipoprotein [Bartonella callosciuri]
MSFSKSSFILVVFAGLLVLLCGCKVEPLYRQGSQISTTVDSVSYRQPLGKKSLGLSEKLASIIVAEPSDRFGQMMRNHLLFLLYRNGSKPSAPAYQLVLQTSMFTRNSVQIEVGQDRKREGRSSVGTVVGSASYILQDMKNIPVGKGMGTVRASFERLRQEYATMQAEEDAQKRVAEELAEQILLLLARDLSKL